MMETRAERNQWLVRNTSNEILGPFTRESLIQQIEDGKLGLQDEVCRANHYWFYLDERDEVTEQLGIEMPHLAPGKSQDEVTDTETETMTRDITPASIVIADAEIPEINDDDSPEDTKILSNRALRRLEDRRAAHEDDHGSFSRSRHLDPKPFVLGRVEQRSFWRVVISAMIILTGLLVALLIRVLQTR